MIFDPNIHIQRIALIGCGGTGAAAARVIARILYAMRRERLHAPSFLLIDPDRVEAKNIGRQALFAPADIGQYKAECVGRRLNAALGLDIGWLPEAIDAERHADRLRGSLLISCVDNHAARQVIHRLPGLLLGSGNHTSAGQVCIGNTCDADLVRRHLDGRDGRIPYLPRESLLFPALLEPEPESSPTPAPSCADLTASGDQHLLINDWLATVIGTYVHQLLYRKPIASFLTFVNLDTLTTRSLPISREEVEAYL